MKLQKDYIKTFDSLKKSEGNICKAHTLKITVTSTSVKNRFAEYFRFAFVYCDFIFKQKKNARSTFLLCYNNLPRFPRVFLVLA